MERCGLISENVFKNLITDPFIQNLFLWMEAWCPISYQAHSDKVHFFKNWPWLNLVGRKSYLPLPAVSEASDAVETLSENFSSVVFA